MTAGRDAQSAAETAKDAYGQLQWAGVPRGEDATCVACGGLFSRGCEPGCFAGEGWAALVEVCNAALVSP